MAYLLADMPADERALVDTIHADPADDAPRLVYADWLDEHAQADQAELIRVQCELARASDDATRRRLARRERELLGTRGGRMPDRLLAGLPSVRGMAVFARRGMPEVLRFRGPVTDARGLDRVLRELPVVELEVDHPGGLQAVVAAGESQPHAGPRAVRWADRGVRHEDQDEAIRGLAQSGYFRDLERLEIHQVYLGGPFLPIALAASPFFPQLRVLALTNAYLQPAGVANLVAAGAGRYLRDLDLSGNPVGNVEAAALVGAGPWTALERLVLDRTQVGPAGARALGDRAAFPVLRELSLCDTLAGGGAARFLRRRYPVVVVRRPRVRPFTLRSLPPLRVAA